MPETIKRTIIFGKCLFFFLFSLSSASLATEGIEQYHIRYDIKSSRNKIVSTHLSMIPAENEFRAENYSLKTASGAISAGPAEAEAAVEKRIKEDALKTILISEGLKSVKTRDYDTVTSYEGVLTGPVRIIKTTYQPDREIYAYEARVEFSPISFPDRWRTLKFKHKIKQGINSFFELFR